MTDTQPDASNWKPTRASTAVALLGTAASVAALTTAVGVWRGAVAAAAGAVLFAVALWLLSWERWRAPATLGASLLLVPAGAAVAAGIGYESLVAFAVAFPAPSPTRVAGQSLRIIGVTAVLWGGTVAAFGASASVRGVATVRTVTRCLQTVTKVSLLPGGLFLALAGHALVTNLDLGAAGMVGDLTATATDWLFAPTPGRPHLLPFWLLLSAASLAVYYALRELPTRELAGEATVGDVRVADVAASLRSGLGRVAAVVLLALPPAFLVETAVPAESVRAALPPAAYDFLVETTAAPGLRTLLWRLALAAGALAGAAALVRRSSRTSTRDLLASYAPYLAGLVVAAAVRAVHRPVLDALVGFVVGRLDAPLAGQFEDAAGRVVAFYGAETVVLGLTTGVLVLAAVAVFALTVAFAFGFVSDRTAGPALAGGGLFLAAAFAGTLETPLWLILGGLVAALVVWDAGEFATTLGSEVGRRADTRRVELLHALAALSLGATAALAAGVLADVVPTGSGAGGELGGLSVALLGAVGGVVLLVMALR